MRVLGARDLAPEHHRARVRSFRHEFQVVGRQQNRLAFVDGQVGQDLADLFLRERIDALDRLVEQQHVRVQQQNLGKRGFLRLTT